MEIVINGENANLKENQRWRGAGMVSGNNTSRLLLDYKTENPEAYWEILHHLFDENEIGIQHLKLEMGSDMNTSSGTEPAVMRHAGATADVTRGAGYQLAADAKKIRPELTLDLLWWSEPLWVTNAADVYAARYQWYKGTLAAAYEVYGLNFDYVSAVQNERHIDAGWIAYLSKALKAETDCPYDYAKIKLVAADEVGSWDIAAQMLADRELLAAVDVIGSHYTSWSDANVKKLASEYGKEVWFSEGCPPMSYRNTYKYDATGTGMNDINGLLDIANRIITMYPGGNMTLYEYQPAVAAYYDGATYSHKQLILANEPWSGYYLLDSGYYMSLHFSRFLKQGWALVENACSADGRPGGDGHAVVDATYSFLTATNPDTGDYSTVLTNTTADAITYQFTVSNLARAAATVEVWETRGNDGGGYRENYFQKISTVMPTETSGVYSYSVTVKPYSIVTVSTLSAQETAYTERQSALLPLPYTDDYEYAGYAPDYLSSRGGAPRYTTDEGGAFEVCRMDGSNVLMQMITPETKAKEWGGTPNPTTNFGDDRWFNYSHSVDVKFAASGNAATNYVGAGLRYHLADAGESGYWVQLFEDGSWKLNRNRQAVCSGRVAGFDSTVWANLRIAAAGRCVRAYLNGTLLAEYDGNAANESMLSAGRAALYSAYSQNCFDNVRLEPIGDAYAITRYDNTDDCVVYGSTAWAHTTIGSFQFYKRTVSEGSEGAFVSISFAGIAFGLTGMIGEEGCRLSVVLDGKTLETSLLVTETAVREAIYYKDGLENGLHTAEFTVVSGKLCLDGVEVTGNPA